MQKLSFRYTGNKATVHTMPCGMVDSVDVVGDPDNAAYEWVILRNGQPAEHSDCAYGSPEVALRDGLIAYLGEQQ
jgi:hypothetical protein